MTMQMICLPVNPKCDVCDLSACGLCPSARRVLGKVKKSTTKIQAVEREAIMKEEDVVDQGVEGVGVVKEQNAEVTGARPRRVEIEIEEVKMDGTVKPEII